MTWRVTDWWDLVLLSLAVYRLFHLLAEDVILDRPRRRLVNRMGDRGEYFLLCPWCLGAWLSLLVWLAWEFWPYATLLVSAPLAISAIVGLIASNLESD